MRKGVFLLALVILICISCLSLVLADGNTILDYSFEEGNDTWAGSGDYENSTVNQSSVDQKHHGSFSGEISTTDTYAEAMEIGFFQPGLTTPISLTNAASSLSWYARWQANATNGSKNCRLVFTSSGNGCSGELNCALWNNQWTGCVGCNQCKYAFASCEGIFDCSVWDGNLSGCASSKICSYVQGPQLCMNPLNQSCLKFAEQEEICYWFSAANCNPMGDCSNTGSCDSIETQAMCTGGYAEGCGDAGCSWPYDYLNYWYSLVQTAPPANTTDIVFLIMIDPTWQTWTQYTRNFYTDWVTTAGFDANQNITDVEIYCEGNSSGTCSGSLSCGDAADREECVPCQRCQWAQCGGDLDCSQLTEEKCNGCDVCEWDDPEQSCISMGMGCYDMWDQGTCESDPGCAHAGCSWTEKGQCSNRVEEDCSTCFNYQECNDCGFAGCSFDFTYKYGQQFFWDEISLNESAPDAAPVANLGNGPVDYFNSSSATVIFDTKCFDDTAVDSWIIYGNWSGGWHANVTNTSAVNNSWFNQSIANLPDGRYVWGYWCNDSSGNTNSTLNRTLIIDSTDPDAEYGSTPAANYNSSSNIVTFNVMCSDSSPIDEVQLWGNWSGGWHKNMTSKASSIVFLAHYDDVNYTYDNENPTVESGTSYDSGKFANAINITQPDQLKYTVTNNFNREKGTFMAWVIPSWDGDDSKRHDILDGGNYWWFTKQTNNNLEFKFGNSGITLSYDASGWSAGEIHHIVATWDNSTPEYVLYIDGVRETNGSTSWSPADPGYGGNMAIGHNVGGGTDNWNGTIDEVLITDELKTDEEVVAIYNSRFNYSTSSYNITINISNIDPGIHTWAVFCNDSFGNTDWTDTNRTFIIDTEAPQFEWVAPTPATGNVTNWDSVYLNATITDHTTTSAFFDWNYTLIKYLAFEETTGTVAFDNSTYADHATLINGTSRGTGKFGDALSFDGTDDWVNMSTESNLGNWSMSLWFKLNEAWDAGNTGAQFIYQATGTNPDIYLYFSETYNGKLNFRCFDPTDNLTSISDSWNADQWYHVAITHDNSTTTKKLYVDGVLQGSASSSCPMNNLTEHLLGSFSSGSDHFFNGFLDQFALFKRVLTPEEINASYNNGVYRLERNFTDLSIGATYNYTAIAIDELGHLNISDYRNVTTEVFVEIELSPALDIGILFGNVDPDTTNNNATNNFNASGNTTYWVTAGAANTVNIDICIKDDYDLVHMEGDLISNRNYLYDFSNKNNWEDPLVDSGIAIENAAYYLTQYTNIAPGEKSYARFWLSVNAAQKAGVYSNTIYIKGAQTGMSGCLIGGGVPVPDEPPAFD